MSDIRTTFEQHSHYKKLTAKTFDGIAIKMKAPSAL